MEQNKLSIEEFLDRDEKKDLLRLLTAGSVDDGKSTLIGRLLFDSKKIYEDQLAALERDSKRMGNAGDHIDYALLCDGLKAEREQGITIDVAYRYFSTNKRKFIIADTPGHEQYTRNMITGGSTANLAIILVDARTGVITQTRRHTFLVSLLGIKHVVLAVNKMDLLDFSHDVFDKIVADFKAFVTPLGIPDVVCIPPLCSRRRQRRRKIRTHTLVRRPLPFGLPRNRPHRQRPQPERLPLSRAVRAPPEP